MQIGFLSRTPRGRCVTLQAYRHLNLEPADGQQMLSVSYTHLDVYKRQVYECAEIE